MIVLWRPAIIPDRDFAVYRHCWSLQAAKWGDEVIEVDTSTHTEKRQWDRVNTTPGRWVVWVRPAFIPLPSFRDELDYYRRENQLIVVQQAYDAVFPLKQDRPQSWDPHGVSPAVVIFQLGGQTRYTLPPSSRVDIWNWLATRRLPYLYRVPQQYTGSFDRGITYRSLLGETVHDPWCDTAFGRIATGEAYWATGERQQAVWRELTGGWEHYLRTWPLT